MNREGNETELQNLHPPEEGNQEQVESVNQNQPLNVNGIREHKSKPNQVAPLIPGVYYNQQSHYSQVRPELSDHNHQPNEPQFKKLEFKLPAISEVFKKVLEDNSIPIPVETPNFELVISQNEDKQYYGEVIKLNPDTPEHKEFVNEWKKNGRREFYFDDEKQQELIFHGQGYYISQNEYYYGSFFFGEFHGKGIFLRWEVAAGSQEFQQSQKTQKYFFGEKHDFYFDINKKEVGQEVGRQGGKYFWYEDDNNQNLKRNGKYVWKDGSYYTGNFLNKEMDGYGIMEFLNGNIYTGQWQRKFMHGFGEYVWANGDQYTGFYKDGQRHGFGHYKWANGIEYIGFYQDGLQHGEGWLKSKKHRPRLHNWRQGAIYNDEENFQKQIQH